MAYREFHNEKYYEAPDTSQAYAVQVQGITNLFRGIQQRQEAKRKAEDQFAYDLDKGAYETDTKILTEVAKNVTNRAKQEIRQSGRISMETEKLMKDGMGWQQQSKNQLDRAKALEQKIVSRSDKYYNPEPDKKLVLDATHGSGNDVDFRTRGEKLAEAEKKLGGIETFKFDEYRSDYVKKVGAQFKEKETPLKNGSSKTIYDQATFWDKNGKPGVTDDHAINYLESDQRVSEWYGSKINTELQNEIKAMKSSGDQRTSWMKGLNDAEIANQLINDPSKNLINNKDYGVRIREKAKSDLSEADRINSKVSYTNLQDTGVNKWTNKNITHSDSMNDFSLQSTRVDDGASFTAPTYGPGGRFLQKNGKAIQLQTNNPTLVNIKTGAVSRNDKGTKNINLNSYELMPFRSNMTPMPIIKMGESNNVQDLIKEINRIPLDYFDPNGKVGLLPEMKIAMNGFTINETGVLGDINDQMVDLSVQMNEAIKSGDKEKIASIESMEYNLQEIKETIAAGDYDPGDLINAANKSGIRKIKDDFIIPANSGDVANIKNLTGGFDLNNKNEFWSEDMKAVDAAYKARAAQAQKENYGVSKTTDKPKQKAQTTIPTVATDADYQKLPSGSEYIGPDGKKRRKK
jgi:hypothetical protein